MDERKFGMKDVNELGPDAIELIQDGARDIRARYLRPEEVEQARRLPVRPDKLGNDNLLETD